MHSVLIVDDDINLCSVLNEELTEIGFDSNFKNNAESAIDFITNNKVDLVLLDLKMPGKDGFFVLNKIKELELNIKVIVLTAYADVQSAIDSAKLGANDFISKPYDLDELIITVRKVLQIEDNEN
jgi:DNA-binding NtrC family response regulator